MATVYYFYFTAVGSLTPFLSLYYRNLGLSGTQISILLSVTPVVLFLSQPIFGPLADRSGHRGRTLAMLMLCAAVSGALMGAATSFWSMLPLIILWSFFASTLSPIADSIALFEVARTGVTYPRLRLWGSIGFLVASIGLGRFYNLINLRWCFVIYGGLMLVARQIARKQPAEGGAPSGPVWGAMGRLLTNRMLLAFLLFSAILQMTVGAQAAFYSVHLKAVGGSNGLVGLAWGVSAATEVPAWLVLGKISKRIRPLWLLSFASMMYAARWWLVGTVTSPEILVGLQLFQAFSFAVYMPTAVQFIGELTPPELRTSGQALLAVVNAGIATVLGTLISGRIVDAAGTATLFHIAAYVAGVAGIGFLGLLTVRSLGQSGRRALQNG